MTAYRRGTRLLLGVTGAATLLGVTSVTAFADVATPQDLDAACAQNGDACHGAWKVVDAIATGNGPQAARLIRACGFADDAPLLGDLIFRAGVQATEPRADRSVFPDAVAIAFVDGGVPILTASDAFRIAATKVAFAGLTPERAEVGSQAVAKTYALYAARGQVTSAPQATTSAAHAVF